MVKIHLKVTKKKYGGFDAALVLGLLYHLDDPFTFLENMAGLCNGFMLLDTHVSLPVMPKIGDWTPELTEMKEFKHKGKTYLRSSQTECWLQGPNGTMGAWQGIFNGAKGAIIPAPEPEFA